MDTSENPRPQVIPVSKEHRNPLGIQKTVSRLLRACSESRKVALRCGSLMPVNRYGRQLLPNMRQVLSKDYIWIDNQIKTLFCVSTLDDVTTIPSNIQAIAFAKLNTKEQASVTSFVESRLEVVDSDDEMLLTYLMTAMEMNREIWLFNRLDERPYDERAEEAISKTRERMRELTHKHRQWQEETGVRFKLAAKFGLPEHMYGPFPSWKEMAGGRDNRVVHVR
ncbi:hypothetical protein DER45DRAFT_534335 [Fusarium avenaceum]|nr:hypothetical protein DER45DRAFT_534335 [Fusarium avenaceum]